MRPEGKLSHLLSKLEEMSVTNHFSASNAITYPMNHCSVTRSDQTEGTTNALPVENVGPVTIKLLKGPNKEPSIMDVDSFAFDLRTP